MSPFRILCALTALCAAVYCASAATSLKINAGGNALGSYVGDSSAFRAGSGAVGSFFNKVGSGPITVYHTHRWARAGQPLVYTLSVTPGVYSVRLQFAENWSGVGFQGGRVFNVDINNVRVSSNIDVWSRAGGLHTPYDIIANGVSPANGKIVVKLTPSRENAYLSGIDLSGVDPNTGGGGGSGTSPSPSPTPSATPTPAATNTGAGAWRTAQVVGGTLPVARHEACAVMVGGKVYLLGGRGTKPVSVFDPATKRWANLGLPPIEMHHMQCAVYQDRYIYVAGAWTGGFPNEQTIPNTYIYDVESAVWSTAPGLGARARGGGAFVFRNGKGYLAMGNRGGHGAHATTLGEFDEYDPVARTWRALPSAPDGRDHVGGGVVGGGQFLCVAGGRDGGVADFWRKPVLRTNCYNFATGAWERRKSIPVGRAGAATGTTCAGHLMVAGGEGIPPWGPGRAFSRVDRYDVRSDSFLRESFLRRGRHGSGLAIADCACGNIYIPSGSAGLGGGPEVRTTELWHPSGNPTNGC